MEENPVLSQQRSCMHACPALLMQMHRHLQENAGHCTSLSMFLLHLAGSA